MIPQDSQQFESYVPVYDDVPEKWEEARQFLVEQFKKISNAINIREIGWYLDEELLSGKAFIPGVTIAGSNPGQFRQILRIVVVIGPITAGVITIPHEITNDANFTLIDLWATATNSTTLTSTIFGNSDTIRIVGPNVVITSDGTYDRCFSVIEYCQEA
jgi:hypothetical protein